MKTEARLLTVFAPHRGNVITLRTERALVNRYKEEEGYQPAYWIEMNHLCAASVDAGVYSPAESTTLTLNEENLDTFIEMLLEHRQRMKNPKVP